MDPFDELLQRVRDLTGLTGRMATAVTVDLFDDDAFGPDRPPSAAEILDRAEALGYTIERSAIETKADAPAPELEMDPANVLKELYRACPRMLPLREGHDSVYVPRVGRAPKESVFYSEEIRAALDELPEEIRVLIGHVNLVDGHVTFTLYDEANDVDREIGPIDLARYPTERALQAAVHVLIGRLQKDVLAADWN